MSILAVSLKNAWEGAGDVSVTVAVAVAVAKENREGGRTS
jgi:hypothetical protein